MRLAAFISNNLDRILADWVAFARDQQPAAASMDETALLDHARLILEEIVANMCRPQGEEARRAKSEGCTCNTSASPSLPSRSHARQRERQGFLIQQMIAEYRALRATVLRLWAAAPGEVQVEDLEEVTRFNEAVDQAIAESVEVFVVEVDKARELFLGVLGHDLRGPLSAIGTSAALLARSHPQDARSVEVLMRGIAHMTALLDDLNVYTRQRLGAGFSIVATAVQLDELVSHTLDEVHSIRSGSVFELNLVGDLQGMWDPQRLHQAFSNLVFNSLKYGGANSLIRIDLDGTDKDEVVISVHNRGRCIPGDKLPEIFNPLVRATDGEGHAEEQKTGANLGLGLYVVREIATAHGGTVEAASDESGTQFNMRLPRVAERRSQPQA